MCSIKINLCKHLRLRQSSFLSKSLKNSGNIGLLKRKPKSSHKNVGCIGLPKSKPIALYDIHNLFETKET